ncbi:MAG TPA: hypothetical protein VMV92_04760 [Streptosporangiaceae bacterium]|nr:hypothetical protein [Streptosporangiaceae bacterium]
MPVPALHAPLALAGDKPGPFSGNAARRGLGMLIDLPAGQRQLDDSATGSGLGVPDPARLLWTLSRRRDIDTFWIADPGDADEPGAVRLREPDLAADRMDFTVAGENGGSIQAVWPYRQWEQQAAASVPAGVSGQAWLRDVLVARVAAELCADLLVTSRKPVLDSVEPWLAQANPLTAEQALGVVGLYLRNRGEYPVAGDGTSWLMFGEHLLFWSAARAQLPSGWRWGSALVAHGSAVGRQGPGLLFGSLHERVVRLLRCRDQIHLALLVPQDNQTANRATEALDYFMVNLVGAFDAAARAAHLALGLDQRKRRRAGWQNGDWMAMVRDGDPSLAALFAPGTDHDRVLEVCRTLRNTVHGEALHTIAVQHGGKPRQTLVALPEDDAEDLCALFDHLGGRDEWGLCPLAAGQRHIAPAVLIERLLPQALRQLDDALRLTPVERLGGITGSTLLAAPPDDRQFGLGTRTRVSLLFGLPCPSI